MTTDEHKQRHEQLHKSLDELLADFLMHNPSKVPSNTSVIELVQWSYNQTTEPTPDKTGLGEEEK